MGLKRSQFMLDDELVIETPERVELRYVLANVGNRFLAAAIDHLIQVIALTALIFGAGVISRWRLFASMGVWAMAAAVLGVFVLVWGYFAAFETLWNGQTPGKRIMRLRVMREDGRPAGFFEVFIRNVIRLAIDLQPFPSYAIGIVSIVFSPRSKRIGDLVAGTVVVKEHQAVAPSLDEIIKVFEIEQRQVEQDRRQFVADLRRLTQAELRTIETFLKRRYELPEPNRSALAVRIAQAISAKLGIVIEQMPPESLLEEIERQHRTQRSPL
jgi:uncharacterized RDD family membrane protein YckC